MPVFLKQGSLPASVALRLIILCVLTAAIGCGRAHEAKPKLAGAPVDAAQVITRDVRVSDEFNGRIWATDNVDVRPRATGYIDRIAFREGQMVHKGDLLYVIDPRPYKDAADNARAELDREHAAADFAKMASAELNLSYTEVRSPIDGRISRTQLTLGNLAQADQTVLTTVVSVDPVYVYFDCDEQSYLRFQQSAHSGTGVGSENPVRVALADEQGFPHAGHIDFVDNQLNPSTGTIRARVVLPNPDHTLTPGLFARIQLQSAAPSQALLIDDKAVLTDQDRKYVYVVGPGNTAQRKDIVLGSTTDGLRIVKSGLTPEDRVIVGGFQLIFFPGAPVAPKTTEMEASDQGLTTNAAAGKEVRGPRQ
jgi:membrane fusion protein, multidrug efflux system